MSICKGGGILTANGKGGPAIQGGRPFRLAALTSHPIQYQAPLFRALAQRPEIDLEVFFCLQRGLKPSMDPGFGKVVAWDIPLLQGYKYSFLKNHGVSSEHGSYHFIFNPGVVPLILKQYFDALWIQGWATLTNWLAWSVTVAAGLPVLLRAESNGLHEPIGFKRRVREVLLRTLFSQVTAFLAIGSNNREFYRSLGITRERIFPVPYSVDNEFFIGHAHRLAGQQAALRQKEGLAPERPVILFAASSCRKSVHSICSGPLAGSAIRPRLCS